MLFYSVLNSVGTYYRKFLIKFALQYMLGLYTYIFIIHFSIVNRFNWILNVFNVFDDICYWSLLLWLQMFVIDLISSSNVTTTAVQVLCCDVTVTVNPYGMLAVVYQLSRLIWYTKWVQDPQNKKTACAKHVWWLSVSSTANQNSLERSQNKAIMDCYSHFGL